MTGSGFDPDTLTLDAERDRLAEEYDETESDLEALDADSARASSKQRYLGDLDQMGRAVSHLIDEYGADATVTVRGLSAGEYAKVENRTAQAAQDAPGSGGVPGSGKLVFAAAGLVSAPFYDGDPDDLTAKLACLADQPIGVRKWLEDLVNERTVVGEKNWRESAGRSSDGA